MRQVVTLGDLVGRVERLEIRCTRCPRQGRVKLSELIAAHGAGMDLPQLGTVLAADCPKATATGPADRCFVIFPDLVNLSAGATAHRPLWVGRPRARLEPRAAGLAGSVGPAVVAEPRMRFERMGTHADLFR